MDMAWWRRDASGLTLAVRIVPRAGADAVAGVANGRLRIRIAAPPIENAANIRLIRFVAGLFGVPRASVRLLKGGRARDKLLAVDGAQRLPELLAAYADERS
jgi:uncharacterized protein (TIGR00251 family)